MVLEFLACVRGLRGGVGSVVDRGGDKVVVFCGCSGCGVWGVGGVVRVLGIRCLLGCFFFWFFF